MRKPRILLVEDEIVVAADIEECVKGLGYQVVGAAASGAEALRLAAQTEPDLVLMDIKLKGALDGIEVAAMLYERHNVPVVYLTAHADAEILERAKKTAPSGYVLKPFDDRTLRTAIELAFEQHRRERSLIETGQRLSTAVGSIDEAVIITNEAGRVTVMNRLAETLTGWKLEDALGRSVADVFTALNSRTGSLQSSPIGRVLREGIGVGLGEHTLLLGKHGRNALVQGSATPVRDAQTEQVGVCLLFRAVAQRARDEDWGSAEHGSANRLVLLGRLTEAVAEQIISVLTSARGRTRASGLAKRLVDFAQRERAPPVGLDLNELVAGMEDLLRCALGSGLELRTALSARTGLVKADPGQIELLLMNLAFAARENVSRGSLFIATSVLACDDSADSYAMLAVHPEGGWHPTADMPALDEITRQSGGEIRITSEDGAVKIFLPKVTEPLAA